MATVPQAPAIKCALEIGKKSIAGSRPDNQDSLAHFASPFGHVFLLADGMGGYGGGSLASNLATSRLPEFLSAVPSSTAPQSALLDAIDNVNRAIVEESRAGGEAVEGMGSTLAALLVRDTLDGLLAIGAHIGDTRIYFLRGEKLFRLTTDHTLVQQLVQSGALTPDQAIDHPQASVLTRALGRGGPLSVDLTSWILLQPGDIFLLCSDGLSGFANQASIRKVLLQHDPPEAIADQLVELALAEESDDNISVLFLRVTAIPAPPADSPQNTRIDNHERPDSRSRANR
jgi:protein phosphatase